MPVNGYIINKSDNPLPGYVTAGSLGMDIRVSLEAPLVLAPMERTLVFTGIFIELHEGFLVQGVPRSGLTIS